MRLVVALWLCVGPSVALSARPKVVVLDPGHGGGLSGTRTQAGVTEASITLQIARVARDVLEKRGVRVLMTRSSDVELDLDSRVARANEAGASAFVSVHNNSSPVAERKGLETYILAAAASDPAALELTEAENEEEAGQRSSRKSADERVAGEGTQGAGGALSLILEDLSRSIAHRNSARLAAAIQERLARVRGVGPSRGLRQAPFRVLRGAKMPAALVEIGYLSNPEQGGFLATERGQRSAGEALAEGILKFLERERL